MPSTSTARRSFDDVSLPPPVAPAVPAPINEHEVGRERNDSE